MRFLICTTLLTLAACATAPQPTPTPTPTPTLAPKPAAALTPTLAQSSDVKLTQGLAGTSLSAAQSNLIQSNLIQSGPAPQALILAGSGPTDRNGNSPLGIAGQSYKLLAEGLSAVGIGTTRVDKRGMFGSAAGAADANSVIIDQLAEDAHLWAKDIKSRTGVTCVWLIGHSEGGLVALKAAQNSEDICGIILVATPGRKIGDVLREQLTSNPANAPILADALSTLTTLEAGRNADVSAMHPAIQGLFAPVVQTFLKALLQINPPQLAANYQGPILILQGTNDLQVTMADANAIKAGQPRAKLVALEGVNHVLKKVVAERGPNLASYQDPSLPIAPEVVTQISDFIRAQGR